MREVIRFFLALTTLMLTLSCDDGGSPTEPETGNLIPENANFSITLDGTVSSRAFRRSGVLSIRPTVTTQGTTNGVNPIEVIIESGNPVSSPQVGAFQFATNDTFLGGRGGQLDTAFVDLDARAGVIQIQPDFGLAIVSLNGFNSSSGLFAEFKAINEGSITLRFTEGGSRVSGTINVLGASAVSTARTRYVASF